MARELPSLRRVVQSDAIFPIIYSEIASSLAFALGLVAYWALGATPLVLLGVGALCALAGAFYAEGSSALRGGSPVIARRAFGDLMSFVVGWAVLLDLIVVATLSVLFVPRYALALVDRSPAIGSPAGELIGAAILAILCGLRLLPRGRGAGIVRITALIDVGMQLVLVLLGLTVLGDLNVLTSSLDFGVSPSWTSLGYAIPIALIAFTGIEVVATLLQDSETPPPPLRRSVGISIASIVLAYAVIATAALSVFPVKPHAGAPDGLSSELSTRWLDAPLAGVAQAFGERGIGAGDVMRVLVSASAIAILLVSASTAISGAIRTLRSLGETGGLPRSLRTRSRRASCEPGGLGLVLVVGIALIAIVGIAGDQVEALASIYSFGILLAFMVVIASVAALRVREPDLPRPVRVPAIALLAPIGLLASWIVWLMGLSTHPAGRIVPPLWLAGGLVVFFVVRRRASLGVLDRFEPVVAPPVELTEVSYGTIVVPVREAGPIELEMLATASKLALARDASVIAVNVIEVPLAMPLDTPLPEREAHARELRSLVTQFARDYPVPFECRVVRARAISGAVAQIARDENAGLILIGAVPHPGAYADRDRMFSMTIENLLRRAPCRVIVTSFPAGTETPEES